MQSSTLVNRDRGIEEVSASRDHRGEMRSDPVRRNRSKDAIGVAEREVPKLVLKAFALLVNKKGDSTRRD